MNVSFSYHKTKIIVSGVILTLLTGITINWLVISFYYNLYTDSIILRILSILISLIWYIIIGLGIYFIIKGTFHYEFQFSETHFKFYKNSKLRIDVPVEEINCINIAHEWRSDGYGGEYEYYIIEIHIEGKNKVRLTIGSKRGIYRFLIFAILLNIYCFKKQIHFNPHKNDKIWLGFKWGYLVDNSIKNVEDDNFFAWYPDMMKF